MERRPLDAESLWPSETRLLKLEMVLKDAMTEIERRNKLLANATALHKDIEAKFNLAEGESAWRNEKLCTRKQGLEEAKHAEAELEKMLSELKTKQSMLR